MTATPFLIVDQVSKRMGETTILDGVSLELRRGERVALTGPSGAGKSTLLNCIGGIERFDSGRVFFGGVDLGASTPEALADVRRRAIGTVFQFFHLLPTLTALENIELPLQLLGIPEAERIQRANTLLERVGLSARSNHRPSELSGGEQQRVAIARAIAHRPPLLLADEPTGALDSRNGAEVLALLRELTVEAGSALLLVTHSPEAAASCERSLHMRDGRIVEQA